MKPLRQNRYTLIEILVVIAILAVLLTFTAKFIYSTNQRCVAMTKLVTANQQRRLLTQAWRSFIGDCDKNSLELNKNGVLISEGREASIKDGELFLKIDEKIRKYVIPTGMNAKITLESFDCGVDTESKPAKFAVIEFTPKIKQKQILIAHELVRIVAVPRKE